MAKKMKFERKQAWQERSKPEELAAEESSIMPPPMEPDKFVPHPLESKGKSADVVSKPSASVMGKTADDYSRQVLNGMTFGFGDNLEAGVNALPKWLGGDKNPNENVWDAYNRNLKEIRGKMGSFQKENPKTAFALDTAGAVIPSIVTGGATSAGSVGTRLLPRVAKGAAVGAVYGGLGAAGNSNAATVPEVLKEGAKGATFGAVTGGAMPVVAQGMRNLGGGIAESARAKMAQLSAALDAASQGRAVDLGAAQRQAQAMADEAKRGINQPLAAELQDLADALKTAPANFHGATEKVVQGTPGATKLVRYDEPHFDLSEERPHGTYFSYDTPGFESPHKDLMSVPTPYRAEVSAKNILTVPEFRIHSDRFRGITWDSAGPSSAGTSALKALSSPDNFNRIMGLSKSELVKDLSEKFPGPDYSRYFDRTELREAYGAQLARARGYDAIAQKSISPDFDEFVSLSKNAIRQPEESLKIAPTQLMPPPQRQPQRIMPPPGQ